MAGPEWIRGQPHHGDAPVASRESAADRPPWSQTGSRFTGEFPPTPSPAESDAAVRSRACSSMPDPDPIKYRRFPQCRPRAGSDRRVMPPASFSSVRQLLMRGRSRMNHQALGIADIGQVRKQLQRFDEFLPGFAIPPWIPKVSMPPAPSGRYFSASASILARFQARIIAPTPRARALPEIPRRACAFAEWHSMRSFSVSSPCRNRNELNGLSAGPKSRSPSTRAFIMYGKVAERFVETDAVVALARLQKLRETALVPGKRAAIDNHAADGRAVAADKLGRRMDHDIRAMLDGPAR